MFEDDEARINKVLEKVFDECSEIAKEMRQSNNALNDVGMLNLLRDKLKDQLPPAPAGHC